MDISGGENFNASASLPESRVRFMERVAESFADLTEVELIKLSSNENLRAICIPKSYLLVQSLLTTWYNPDNPAYSIFNMICARWFARRGQK